MSESSSSRRSQYDRENELFQLFVSSNDLSVIEATRTDENSWLMAFGRYLKQVRMNQSDFYPLATHVLNTIHPTNHHRALFLILKQCIRLYPHDIVHMPIRQHLCTVLTTNMDAYLQYKYVRLLRLLVDQQLSTLEEILPPLTDLIISFEAHQLDPSIIIVLQKIVLINKDSTLQLSLNRIYERSSSLLHLLQSSDFDDDETIDLCYLLFQINLLESIQCSFTISQVCIDLFAYIEYDTDTMLNWLLTPETGQHFLIFILRLIKYFAVDKDHHTILKDRAGHETYDHLVRTIVQFREQLDRAHRKSLFPYNIKPLLNVFDTFHRMSTENI